MSAFEHHRRKISLRLLSWDYSSPGWYFVTVCTKNRKPLLGTVAEDAVHLSSIGVIIEEEWKRVPVLRPHVQFDEWSIMPNHIHGIIILQSNSSRASQRDAPTTPCLVAGSLGAVINQFKSKCTKRIRSAGNPNFAWQRGYHDHIIRSEGELARIRRYIRDNPRHWLQDPYHTG